MIGAIGVDTLHDLTQVLDSAEALRRAEAFRRDPAGSCRAMVGTLFHPGSQGELRAWAEERMCAMPGAIVAGLMEGLAGYDLAAAARRAGVPLRAIDGDLWPVSLERNRTVAPDFDAAILAGTGHYPLLEQPAEFNRLLVELARALESAAPSGR